MHNYWQFWYIGKMTFVLETCSTIVTTENNFIRCGPYFLTSELLNPYNPKSPDLSSSAECTAQPDISVTRQSWLTLAVLAVIQPSTKKLY